MIGTGGFASGPLLYVASKLRVPTLIQEQNSYPGLTNKILSRSVNQICVSYPKMEKYFPNHKLIYTGNPVRKEILNINLKKDESTSFFNLKQSKKTVLILGGSLGASRINEFISENLNQFKSYDLQIIWQCGKNQYHDYKKFNSSSVIVKPFIEKMNYAYMASDYIISRSGASIISELCIVGKPVIFIPSPNVAEDHQIKNAMSLVKLNSAELVIEKDLNTKFFKIFEKIHFDNIYSKKLSKSIKNLAKPDASKIIVNQILKSIDYA